MTNEIIKPETKSRLKNYVFEIERLTEEKTQLQIQIKTCIDRAASEGFDVKNIKEIIKLRKIDKQKMVNSEETRELYKGILIEL